MKKNDILLIGILMMIAIGMFFVVKIFQSGTGGTLEVSVDGRLYETVHYGDDTTREIRIDHNGNLNVVRISDGKIKMVYADCPDQVCVHHRPIQYNNQTIVCLPNKVVVEITNQTLQPEQPDEVDGISG